MNDDPNPVLAALKRINDHTTAAGLIAKEAAAVLTDEERNVFSAHADAMLAQLEIIGVAIRSRRQPVPYP